MCQMAWKKEKPRKNHAKYGVQRSGGVRDADPVGVRKKAPAGAGSLGRESITNEVPADGAGHE